MDSSVSPKDEICFLRVYHHVSTGLYILMSVGDCADPRTVVRPEGLNQWKIPIESAIFRLLAHCLNQQCHRVPPSRVTVVCYFNWTTELYRILNVPVLCGFETCVSTEYCGGQWWAVVKTVMNLQVSEMAGNCLNGCAVCTFRT